MSTFGAGPTCGFVRLDGRVAMVAERKIEVQYLL